MLCPLLRLSLPEADPGPPYSLSLGGPSLHQGVGALKLAHHSSDKVFHLLKVTVVNAARAINQEDNIHLLIWTLCREGEKNQRCVCESQSSPGTQNTYPLHRVRELFLP